MAQAKTLTQTEIDKVLAYIAAKTFAQRNRVMLLTSFWSGMRVGEISSLKVGDVMNADGTIKHEVRLASLAGHRSIAVTQKYIDVNDDMKRNAVELV